jgi:hypothetical protein
MSRTKKRFKSASCPNCHTVFADEHANFCAHCGQENHTHKLPMKHFAMELVESFTHFDTKVIATFKDLIFTPGLVIKNFNDNKRARYVPPIRIYAFTSFAFFLIVSFMADKKIETASQKISGIKEINGLTVNNTKVDEMTHRELMAIPNLTNSLIDSILHSKKIETNWRDTRILHRYIKIQKGEISLTDSYKQFVKSSSYTIFVLMPIFAFLLMFFYRKRNYYYSEFLVFSIYFHTFIFSIFSILIILHGLTDFTFDDIINFLLLGMMIYLGLSLKRVFEDSIPKTILKTVLLSVIYSVLLLSSVATLVFRGVL